MRRLCIRIASEVDRGLSGGAWPTRHTRHTGAKNASRWTARAAWPTYRARSTDGALSHLTTADPWRMCRTSTIHPSSVSALSSHSQSSHGAGRPHSRHFLRRGARRAGLARCADAWPAGCQSPLDAVVCHRDADAERTWSVLFAVTERRFHFGQCAQPLDLAAGEVLESSLPFTVAKMFSSPRPRTVDRTGCTR